MSDTAKPDATVGTSKLFEGLYKAKSLGQFMRGHDDAFQTPSFHEYLTRLCRERGEVPERVISRANVESSYGHQLFKGTRRPSRDTVLQLAFGLEADVDTAQLLLRYAGRSPLYPRIKRDAAIVYCLHHQLPLADTQAILQEMDLPLIGGRP